VRLVGDLMIVNHERNPTPVGRRAEQLPTHTAIPLSLAIDEEDQAQSAEEEEQPAVDCTRACRAIQTLTSDKAPPRSRTRLPE
jgi:hypothetical protein